MKIKVTAEDIEKGLPMSPILCPIAKAIRREFRDTYVYVAKSKVRLSFDGHNFIRIPLPVHVKKFIKKFDWLQKVEPFEFELLYEPS